MPPKTANPNSLAARFGHLMEPGTALEGARSLPLDRIDPNPAQPRQWTDGTALAELAEDIAAHGLLHALLVRPHPTQAGRYQVIAGGRRLAAARMAGLDSVDVRIVEWDDATARAASIRENVHREDMDPEDEGRFYQALQAGGMTIREVAAAIGKSKSYVDRRVQLVNNPAALQAYQDARAAHAAAEEASQPLLLPDADQGPGPPTPAPDLVPARDKPHAFTRRDNLYKPLVSAVNHVARLQVGTLEPDDRATLRDHIDNLMGHLEALRAELDSE